MTCICLVVGNVVGAGFYLSPAALAPFGMVAVLGWFLLAIGAMCIGIVFARLSSIAPAAGGPYAFARQAFGPLSGFMVAWTYWISIWASLPAIALTLAGYLLAFFPGAKEPWMTVAVALAAMWGICLLSFRGTATVGSLQRWAVALKILPFVAIGTIGLFWVRPENLMPLNPSGMPILPALSTLAPLVMFAFLGIESATVPAGDVDNPKVTIPRATLIGAGICALLYIFCTIAVMGVIPREQLAASSSPFADAARVMWGSWAGSLIGVAVVLSSLAALNGWTLLLGQVPLAAAKDGAFPRVFGRVNSRGAPAAGLSVSLTFSSLLLVAQGGGGQAVAAAYEVLVQLSTTANMIPYIFCAVAEAMLVKSLADRGGGWRIGPFTPAALIAFGFSVWVVIGSGATAAMWTLVLMVLALPIYVVLARRQPEPALEPFT
ncbi:amino acid permease [Brevundimonas sp. Root1423]|uniref:amino acid permease n=1 Tax=Brevundimonas sp. Root1423 TaxID=1736462 RepID=UPI00190FE895|nr:amino acid permease [Brevundimonas sp. Root1423]